MNRVLILSYCYPPARYVASQRPFALARQLAKSGIQATVVTRDWEPEGDVDYFGKSLRESDHIDTFDSIRVIKTRFIGIYTLGQRSAGGRQLHEASLAHHAFRKLFVALSQIGQYFMPIGPYANIYHSANRELNNKSISYDVIVAHGEPFVLFSYASTLGKRHNIPWIADYRDPWSLNPLASISIPVRYILKNIEYYLIRSASAVTCATDYVARYTPDVKAKTVINNGYDLACTKDLGCQVTINKSILHIAFAGTIQPWDRWQETIDVVNGFNMQVKLTFIGTNINSDIEKYVRRTYPAANIEIFERQPHGIVTGMLAQADALLLFNNYAAIGTKVYEYLATRKHILFCYDSNTAYTEDATNFRQCKLMKGINVDCQQKLIESYTGGTIVRDKAHLVQEIARLVRVKQASGCIPSTTKNTDELNRATQMEKFVRLIQYTLNNSQ